MSAVLKRSRGESIADAPKAKKIRFDGQTGKPVVVSAPVNDTLQSLLRPRTEEVDFPRGGGTNLTQIEYKALRQEAVKELNEELAQSKVKNKKNNRKSKSALNTGALAGDAAPKEKIFVPHRLFYKNVTKGAKILGQVVSMKPLALVVALPGSLLGHIPLTKISSTFAEKVEELATREESDVEEDEVESPDLEDMYHPGDFVRVIVTEVHPTATKVELGARPTIEEERHCGRLELSLSPELVNEGLTKDDLVTGVTISATVKSLEDHGHVLDLGIFGVSGFLNFSDAQSGSHASLEKLPIGMVILCTVLSLSSNGRICTLSTNPQRLRTATTSEASSLTSVLPGALVNGLITDKSAAGIELQILGLFSASVNTWHLPHDWNDQAGFRIGAKLQARVLYDIKDTTPPSFAVSVLPHLISLTAPTTHSIGGEGSDGVDGDEEQSQRLEESFPKGTRLDKVKVLEVIPKFGVNCLVANKALGFVSVHNIPSEEIAQLETNKWKTGSLHPARIIGLSPIDGVLTLTMQPNEIDQQLFTLADVAVGDVIKVTVKRLAPTYMVVNLSATLTGIVSSIHFSDIVLKHPERKFPEGSSVKARVLSKDPVNNSIRLTLKKSLINSDLPMYTSFEDVKLGDVVHGTIWKLIERGLFVEFSGSTKAFVSFNELSDEPISSVAESFKIGQVVKTRIVRAEPSTRSIQASIRQALPSFVPTTSLNLDILKIGENVSGTVREIRQNNLLLELQPSGLTGSVSFAQLAKRMGKKVADIRPTITAGTKVPDLYVSEKVEKTGIVKCTFIPPDQTAEPSATRSNGDRQMGGTEEAIKSADSGSRNAYEVGQEVSGKVVYSRDGTCRISLPSGVTGIVDPAQAQVYLPKVGQILSGTLTRVNRRKVHISMKPPTEDSAIEKSNKKTVRVSDLEEGQPVSTHIVKIGPSALTLKIDESRIHGSLRRRDDDADMDTEVASAIEGLKVGDALTVHVLRINAEKETCVFTVETPPKAEPTINASEDVPEEEATEMHDPSSDEEESSDNAEEDTLLISNSSEVVAPGPRRLTESAENGSALKLTGGFNWSGNVVDSDEDMQSDSESSEPEARPSKSKKKSKKGEIQKDLSASMHDKTPESSAEFERMLKASPNSSFLWIQFMAFQLQLSEVEKARQIGHRALEVINFREEQEKLNVWLALLNLEIAYGTEETRQAVFADSSRANDAQTIHLRYAALLDEAGKQDEAEEMYTRTSKKFGTESEVWTTFGEFYLKNGKLDEARALLPRSLKSLERPDHLRTVIKFAQLEYKLGEPERGKTIFEGAVNSHPKRLDLWTTYVDQEAKIGNIDAIRIIFGRLLAQKLTSKQAKSTFKRWLELERSIGTETGAENVKTKAIEWTQQNAKADM